MEKMVANRVVKNADLQNNPGKAKSSFVSELKNNKVIYLFILMGFSYYIVFHFIPMFGIVMAFQDFSPGKGFLGSEWVGLQNFKDFFNSVYFVRVLRNTVLLNFYQLLWSFPV
ncbi:MAG: hypothetical protein Q4C99_10485, partial [Clostridia bacterium]|nr:hypothetical protein [Clostridia bacterium]